MAESPRTGRLVSFTLRDLPPGLLQRAKDVAMRREDNPIRRVEIGLAAERPSSRVHWVSAAAWDEVFGSSRK